MALEMSTVNMDSSDDMTPLIDNNKDKRFWKSNKFIFPLILFVAAFMIILAYSSFAATPLKGHNAAVLADADSAEFEPEITILEFDWDQLNEFAPDSNPSELSFGSPLWTSFHSHLITQNGYDPNDKSRSFVFKVYDDVESAGLTKHTASSNLECRTVYAFTEGSSDVMGAGASIHINCMEGNDLSQLVGCISYAPQDYGFRAGEEITFKTIEGPPEDPKNPKKIAQCKTWNREGAERYKHAIGVGARCCKATNTQHSLYVNLGYFKNSEDQFDRHNGHCYHGISQCDNLPGKGAQGPSEEAKPVMCTTDYGKWIGYGESPGCDEHSPPKNLDCGGWTGKPLGTFYSEDKESCIGARGEEGFMRQYHGCLGSSEGTVECHWRQATEATENAETNNYESRVGCAAGYALSDCNSFVYVEDGYNGECPWNVKGSGIALGGFYEKKDNEPTKCVAVGNNKDIRAQASCCRVDNS